ncbi:Chloride channel protein 2 [Triplophysa tibetana]|uniref:Chloride channel protein 2 n=1 Tax=Triplophysa tibetana TaxID=1572043 RepID=A0A5A9PD19_9TELE|nr:Chloride channel protein 2 [Triplophysa tibetana]
MYGRYTQELGAYAKEEAARLREDGALRRTTSVRGQAPELQEYEKDPCAKCQASLRQHCRRAFNSLNLEAVLAVHQQGA